MKLIQVCQLSLLLIMLFLSSCIINQHPSLKLNLKIGCQEYEWDGETESGEPTSGQGTHITLDGKITYNSFTASELKNVVAKITVYDVGGLKFDKEIPVRLSSSRTSSFKEEFDFENSFYCSEQKYTVAFYSSEGVVVPHRGDFENSINNPSYSGPTPTPNYTQDAILNTVFTAVWQTAEASTNVAPSPTPSP